MISLTFKGKIIKLDTTTTNSVYIKIKGNHKINVHRHELKIDNSIELIKTVIDSIKCPHCHSTIYIIHDLNNKKPLPDHIYCPNCKENIFSRILIASKLKKLSRTKRRGDYYY